MNHHRAVILSDRSSRQRLCRLAGLLALAALLWLALAGAALAQTPDLIISEYIEGSSNNKALEFYNASCNTIDLAAGNYIVEMYFNGSASVGTTVTLTGTVASKSVFVLAHASANAAILAQADQTNSSSWYNGDDAVVLKKGGASGTVLDCIGQVGSDPGSQWGTGLVSTADNTLRRLGTVCFGDTTRNDAFDPSVEWDGYATDDSVDLGAHASGCPLVPEDLFISEYIEGSSNNKALEFYNGTCAAIDLTAGQYVVQFYFNGSTSSTLSYNLTGTVASGDVFVLAHYNANAAILAQADQLSLNNAGWYNGDDAIVLRKGGASGTVLDCIGQVGSDPGTEWGTGLASTADNTLRRKLNVCAGDPVTNDAFDPSIEWDGYAQNDSANLGAHTCVCIPDEPLQIDCDSPYTLYEGTLGNHIVSADDPDDMITGIAITNLAPTPATGTIFTQNFTAGGMGTPATVEVVVSADVPAGTYVATLEATNETKTDRETLTCALTITVIGVYAIHDIQGPGLSSPLVTQLIRTENNVVTGVTTEGFFIQAPTGSEDADPSTSEGIYVYTGVPPVYTSDASAVLVQDLVNVVGTVSEYYGLTEIGATPTIEFVSRPTALPAAMPLSATLPDPTQPYPCTDLERYEGMIVSASNGLALEGTDMDGDFKFTLTGIKPFRDDGILYPGLPGLPTWDGDPEIIEVGTDDLDGLVDQVRGGDTVVSAEGPLFYDWDYYTISASSLTVDPASPPLLPRPVRDRVPGEFTIAHQNIVGFYNSTPTWRLEKLSLLVREVLKAPDILAVQEVESQAILQTLADQIHTDDASLTYTAYLLEESWNHDQYLGYLVRDTVQVNSVTAIQADETFTFGGNVYTLHDRPPLLLDCDYIGAGVPVPLQVINIHNKSLIGNDDLPMPNRNQVKRHTQATRISQEIQLMQEANPDMPIILVGDFNAFEFTDGYVDCIGQIIGNPDLNSFIVGTDEVDPDFIDQAINVPADDRYSYVENGTAQVLDHALTSLSTERWVNGYEYIRGNSEATYDDYTDSTNPLRASDHDGGVLFLQPIAIGDFVWVDTDQDGVQDAGEPGQPGVSVELHADLDGSLVATATTDANGLYMFYDVLPGDYYLRFVLPAGFVFTSQDAAAATDATDSDADTVTGETITTTLSGTERDFSWDAGLITTYTITASCTTGGTITPTGVVIVLEHANQAFTIAADTGNSIEDVLVDGVSQGPLASYTFTDVLANHTIHAIINLHPVAINDNYNGPEDIQLAVDAATGVLSNDTDPENDPLTAIEGSTTAFGTLTFNADGSFTYMPGLNFFGQDFFTYQSSDGATMSDLATAFIDIGAVNDAPLAANDSYTGYEDSQIVANAIAGLLGNDFDQENTPLNALAVDLPLFGTLDLQPDGSFVYEPGPDYFGQDLFTYQSTDGELLSNLATVTLRIRGINDLPLAADLHLATVEDTPVGGQFVGQDVDGPSLSFQLVAGPMLGTLDPLSLASGAFVYVPNPFTTGVDVFTYAVTDGLGLSVPATVTVDIEALRYRTYAAHVAENDDWSTQFWVMNLGAGNAPVHFHAFDAAGAFLESATLPDLPPMGVFSAGAGELFSPETLAADLWVRVGSPNELHGVQTFGTRDDQSMVGLPLFDLAGTDLLFPYVNVSADWYTGITLINTGAAAATVQLAGHAESGEAVDQAVVSVPSRGKYVRLVEEIFAGKSLEDIRFLRAQSDQPLVGFELFGATEEPGLSGMPAMLPSGGSIYQAKALPTQTPVEPVSFQGWAVSGTAVQLAWDPWSNPEVDHYVVYTMENSFVIRETVTTENRCLVTDLAPEHWYTFQVGAVNADGEGNTTRFIWVRTLPDGAQDGRYRLFYNELPALSQYFTGIGICNVGEASAPIHLTLYDTAGLELWETSWEAAPFEQITRAVDVLFDSQLPAGAAYLKAWSDQPLAGFELYYSRPDARSPFRFDGLMGKNLGARRMVFPMVPSSQEWTLDLQLTDLSNTENDVIVRAWSADGLLLGTWQQRMDPGSQLKLYPEEMFPGHNGIIAALDLEAESVVTGSLCCVSKDFTRLVSYLGLVTSSNR